jgi:hypothetical protein
LSSSAEKYFEANDHEAALAEAIKGGKMLRGSIWKPWIGGETQMSAISTLREVVDKFQIKTLKGYTGMVNSVSYSPDGKTLASASDDNRIILWNLDLDDLLVKGCGLIRGYLQNNPDGAEDKHLCDNIKNNS